MTWVTCSQVGWGAGGSPGTRTSSNWLVSKVICPCFLAASRTAKPEYTDWLNPSVPKLHARLSQDVELQSSTNSQSNAGSWPLGYLQLCLGMFLGASPEDSFCSSAKVQLKVADMCGDRLHVHNRLLAASRHTSSPPAQAAIHLGRRLALWSTPAVGVDLVWWCRCVRGKECSQGSSQGSQVCVSRDRRTWAWQAAPSPPYTERHQVPRLPEQPGKHNRSLLSRLPMVICYCTLQAAQLK